MKEPHTSEIYHHCNDIISSIATDLARKSSLLAHPTSLGGWISVTRSRYRRYSRRLGRFCLSNVACIFFKSRFWPKIYFRLHPASPDFRLRSQRKDAELIELQYRSLRAHQPVPVPAAGSVLLRFIDLEAHQMRRGGVAPNKGPSFKYRYHALPGRLQIQIEIFLEYRITRSQQLLLKSAGVAPPLRPKMVVSTCVIDCEGIPRARRFKRYR